VFAGPSGTGKTLPPQVLLEDLELDLFCVDVIAFSAKCIGQTEKNLARKFAQGRPNEMRQQRATGVGVRNSTFLMDLSGLKRRKGENHPTGTSAG
jgi:hypothetical protein